MGVKSVFGTPSNSFILELAKIAGSGDKVIIGMGVHTRLFHERKERGEYPKDSNPYLESAKKLSDDYIDEIMRQKRVWKRMSVNFVFDQGNKD